MSRIIRRPANPVQVNWPPHLGPVLQRIYLGRGIIDEVQLEHGLANLLKPQALGGMAKAVDYMIHAIRTDKHITVAGDYDCDGATGSAVAVRGLRLLGAKNVRFVVPNRFVHGYGLSTGLVDAMHPSTEVIVTVDSGTSSVEGVDHARTKGMDVVITDHHLPGPKLPDAIAIVNPNLDGDPFPSKSLAGVGVMFYLLIAIRAEMRARGLLPEPEPDIASLLDLVALGTIADLVALDQNNRILVTAGLRRIRQGRACEGIKAIMFNADKNPRMLVASDIGFTIGPRLNAAGRLEDMSLGVQTLITDNAKEAQALAAELETINSRRKEMQADMIEQAEKIVAATEATPAVGVVVYDPSWHSGIVGLVASKLKESLYRPVFAFAPSEEGSTELRGSGRSIPGFHLRDALALVDVRNPGLMPKYGGHEMAAGMSLDASKIEQFSKAFDEAANEMLDSTALTSEIFSDGELRADEINLRTAWEIRDGGPWGQKFPEPIFDNVFEVLDYRILKEKHLKLELLDPRSGMVVDGIMFSALDHIPPPKLIHVAYELQINFYRGDENVQLLIRHIEGLGE